MIDPAEALVAVTGLGLLTGERQASISLDEIERAAKLEATIETRTKQAVNGETDLRGPAPVNFKRALKRLSAVQKPEDHVERMTKFPPGYHQLAMSYNILLHQLQPEILKMLPRQTFQNITGTDVAAPADLAMQRFYQMLQVIDEPLTVFRHINNGSLLKKQALAVKTICPTFAQAVTDSLFQCVVEKKAVHPSWMPNWILNKGLCAWFESSSIPPDMLRRLQLASVNVANRKAAQEQPETQGGSNSSESPAQRVQFGKV
jgi:hypothetical protein